MSTHNIGFYEDLTKIIFELSSNIIKSSLIVSIHPVFYGNINTNASLSLQTSYNHYKCIAINKNGLRLITKMMEICFLNEF